MPTLNQLSTQNFDNNLLLNSLNMPDRMSRVRDISGGYNGLTMFIDKLSATPPRRVYGIEGKFEKSIIGRNTVIQPINGISTLNANGTLTVTLADPNYNLFRVGRVVLDSNNFEGRTIQVSAGSVTIQPLGNPLVFVAATHFNGALAGGCFIKDGWDASINMGSTGSSSLYEYPTWLYNYTSVVRANSDWFRRNESSTWVKNDGKFWWSSIDEFAAKQFLQQEEYRIREGVRSQTTALNGGGVVNQSGGIYWAIKDMANDGRGGVDRPMVTNPVASDLEDFIMEIANRTTSPQTRLIGFIGRGALANIQTNMTLQFISNSGVLNTFGGKEVKGVDVKTYSIAGVTVDFILDPYVSNKERFPELSTAPGGVIGTKRSNDLLIFSEESFPVIGGGTAPAMERCYFGEKDINYGYMNGIGMEGGGMPISMNGQTFKQIVSNRDSIEFMIYSDSCPADVVATNMGYMYLNI